MKAFFLAVFVMIVIAAVAEEILMEQPFSTADKSAASSVRLD